MRNSHPDPPDATICCKAAEGHRGGHDWACAAATLALRGPGFAARPRTATTGEGMTGQSPCRGNRHAGRPAHAIRVYWCHFVQHNTCTGIRKSCMGVETKLRWQLVGFTPHWLGSLDDACVHHVGQALVDCGGLVVESLVERVRCILVALGEEDTRQVIREACPRNAAEVG